MTNQGKTELELLAEIDAKGYTTVEHGRGFGRKSFYGARRANARNRLLEAGLIRITHSGHETDSQRGYSSFHLWSRIERVKSV